MPSRPPILLVLLLVYQMILVFLAVVCGTYYAAWLPVWGDSKSEPFWDVVVLSFVVVILACWGATMGYASVGMMMRSPRAFLLAMICHLLLEIPGLALMLSFGFFIFWALVGNKGAALVAPLFVLFFLMWLPFVLISGWAFFYLRDMRRRLMTTGGVGR
jgi:hypothetical protein